jgi:glycosyltransferase involved in cell wall biosynthesis
LTEHPRLYYLDDIPTPYRLGVQRRVAQEWRGAFKIAYCAESEPGRDWSFNFSDLNIEILPGWQYRPRRQTNPMSFKWNPTVATSLERFRPDVVVLSGYVHPTVYQAAIWCHSHQIPYGIACETSAHSTTLTGLKWQIKRWIAGSIVRRMDFGLPVGRNAANYLQLLGARDVQMFYFPNTPDTSVIRANAERIISQNEEGGLRRHLGIPEGSKIILFVGRMIDAKRPMDVLDAFRRLGSEASDVSLVFVGDGPLLDHLKGAATEDDRIVCTGWLTDTDKTAALMAISSMLVLPSQHETWGAVVNEAMAAGTPVIASDRVGAATELIESGVNGLIHSVGNIADLAKAIRFLLTEEGARSRMASAARVTALARGHEFAAANLIAGALHGIRQRRDQRPE